MKLFFTAVAVFLTVGALNGVARADESVDGNQCWAKPIFALNGVPKLLFGNSTNDKNLTYLGVSFTNKGDQPLTDIRVHYVFSDAFGTQVDSLDGVWSGSFAPNVVISFMPPREHGVLEERPLQNADHVKDVTCTITGARWADGTVLTQPVHIQDSSPGSESGSSTSPVVSDSPAVAAVSPPVQPLSGTCSTVYAAYETQKALADSNAMKWEAALNDDDRLLSACTLYRNAAAFRSL
ncbi:MAG TPA: hypothetical protein VGF98_14635 [Candidatus Tumulicola sp.]|jgi:hypothetical protein